MAKEKNAGYSTISNMRQGTSTDALPEFTWIAAHMGKEERSFMNSVLPGFIANALSCAAAPVSDGEQNAWDILARYRRLEDFPALPLLIQQELGLVRDYIRKRSPGAGIKLTGSWERGTWADAHSSAAFRAMRLRVRKKAGTSDLDILTNAAYPFTRQELQALVTTRIDLWKVRYERVTGILF